MFERRLQTLLVGLAVALAIIVGRLTQLQIVDADYYRLRAEQAIKRRPKQVPFVRGSILDRTGEVLVQDEPCWDIAVDYGVIAADFGNDPSIIRSKARRLKRRGRYPNATTDDEAVAAFTDELAAMWLDIARCAGNDSASHVNALHRRASEVYKQVRRVRHVVAARRGFDAPVAEEARSHAIVSGLGPDSQIAARESLARYPWVHVRPSSQRRFGPDSTPFAHILGRLGRVDATDVKDDLNADDPFAKYLSHERLGISGVEWAAEEMLRGRRGQITLDEDGQVVEAELIAPQDGEDVTLTIHADLQQRLYQLMGDVVDEVAESSGGSIVVLDVRSRELLALVSYPSYDPASFDAQYDELRDDTGRLPLRFRAVSNQYAPGSTVKPLACLAGLMNGALTLDHREDCTGYLFPDVRDRWRCWQIHGTDIRKAHGPVDVVGALTGSCNVFMYALGERLGVDALCSVFDMVGIGKPSGIGLREETRGINPTPSWLMTHKNVRATPGTARLFAIGQGELSLTPLQVANLMATYASGRYRPVTLWRKASPPAEWIIPATRAHWRAIRHGIYGVVNDPEGTAHDHVKFEHEAWALCAKTGSATAHPWPTAYGVPYVDEDGVKQVALVPAGAKRNAVERFRLEHPGIEFDPGAVEVVARWPRHAPPPGQRHSHAWVAGFLQARDAAGQPDWSQEPRVAFAILVEFGGSGGRTTGPMAGAVARVLLDVFGPNLVLDSISVAQANP